MHSSASLPLMDADVQADADPATDSTMTGDPSAVPVQPDAGDAAAADDAMDVPGADEKRQAGDAAPSAGRGAPAPGRNEGDAPVEQTAGSAAPSEPPEDDPAAGSGAPSEPPDAGPPAGSGIPAPTGGWNPWIDLIAILSQATLTLESIAELAQDLASLSLDNQLAIVVLNALETSGLCDATDHLACDPVCVVMATQLPSCRFDESCRDALVNVCGP